MLILSSDISGSGLLTGLAIIPDTTATQTVISDMTVKIAHLPSTTTVLTSANFADNYAGIASVTVTQNLAYNISAGQPDPVWIPFNNSNFTYNGTSNLLIDISCTVSSGSYSINYKTVPGNRVLTSSDPAVAAGILRTRAFEPVLRFHGGTVNIIIGGTGSYSYPFSSLNNNKSQQLYLASELGTTGKITRIARRLNSINSTVSEYNSFTVMLGHTTNTSLGTVFSANLTGAQTVYNGTFSVTGGLVKGDWIEIPLSTPFAYDSAKNLVVQISTLKGTATNYVFDTNDPARFVGREAEADNNTSDTCIVGNWLGDLKLVVE